MMTDAISKSLGVAEPKQLMSAETEVARVTDVTRTLVDAKKENQTSDYEDARTNIKSIIKDSMSLVPDLVNLTREAYSDKMYKAAAEFLATLADLNVSLVGLSETKEVSSSQKIKPEESKPQEKREVKVFIGTTEEMLDRVSSQEKLPVQIQDNV